MWHIDGNRERGSQEAVAAMVAGLSHRGPDDSHIVSTNRGPVFGFRRLAIQDLSEAGRQPMQSRSGRYTLVFNGEIYNHQSLRRELPEGFRGHSDTETLLAALDRWGLEATLPRLIGMFAIGLWDAKAEELHLARDRLGIKPLYYTDGTGTVSFASELKALMAAGSVRAAIDPAALAQYMHLLFVPEPASLVAGVSKVRPGEVVSIPRHGRRRRHRFWSLEEEVAAARPRRPLDAKAATDELGELLTDAVRLRLLSDVPLGTLLSGGIDSTLITAIAQREMGGGLRTFSVGFDVKEHDESHHARAIARHLRTDHTELAVTTSGALDAVDEIAWLMDEPLADPSIIPTFQISREARRSVTVALSGDGGDELFAGYNRYAYGRRLIPRLAQVPRPLRRLASAAGLVGGLGGLDRLHGLIESVGPQRRRHRLREQKLRKLLALLKCDGPAAMYAQLLSPWQEAQPPLIGGSGGSHLIQEIWERHSGWSVLDRMLFIDQKVYLPGDLLAKVDRASMAASLEARVPLLDHRIVEFSWRAQNDLKINGAATKWLLRRLLARYVPPDLTERPKVGFTVPVAAWLRGPLRGWGTNMLDSLPEEFINMDAVHGMWRRFQEGRSRAELAMWTLAVLGAWRRRFIP